MPDDRFADLGGEPREPPSEPAPPAREPDRRSAAERFEELDEREPEQRAQAPEPPRPSGRYTWLVGIVFVFLLIVAGANALRHSGAGYRGVPVGKRLAPFAAPLATSDHDNDASIQPRAGGGHPAACSIHLAGVVNLCDLRARPLVLTFVANGQAGCATQLDRVERVRRAFRGVNFLGVVSRRSLAEAKALVRRHGWTFPVALDRDAAIFNLYGVGDCPTTVFARGQSGVSAGSRNGDLSVPRLRRAVTALVQGDPLP